jgi:hypothetical protein
VPSESPGEGEAEEEVRLVVIDEIHVDRGRDHHVAEQKLVQAAQPDQELRVVVFKLDTWPEPPTSRPLLAAEESETPVVQERKKRVLPMLKSANAPIPHFSFRMYS